MRLRTIILSVILLALGLLLGQAGARAQSLDVDLNGTNSGSSSPRIGQSLIQPTAPGAGSPEVGAVAPEAPQPQKDYKPLVLTTVPAPMVVELFTS